MNIIKYFFICLLCLHTISCERLSQSGYVQVADKDSTISKEETVDKPEIKKEDDAKKILKSKTTYKIVVRSDTVKKVRIINKVEYDSLGYKECECEYIRRNACIDSKYCGSANDNEWMKISRACGIPFPEQKAVNFRYDSKMKEVETFIYQMEGYPVLFKSKYNSDGCVVEKCASKQYKKISRNTYKYDTDGKEIEECCYNGAGKLDYKYTYQYDSIGNLSEKHVYNSDGDLTSKTIFYYNTNGDCIKYCEYSTDGTMKGVSKNTYIIEYQY